jgi:phosphopantothenate synthetase
VTIVDDVNRAVLRITAFVKNLKGKNEKIKNLIENFNNEENLNAVIEYIGVRMKELASKDK